MIFEQPSPSRLLTIFAPLFALVASPSAAGQAATAKATFAGGCFWCMEEAFEKVPGVVSVVSGYIGGLAPHPTYQQVSAGGTGHAESVEISYDPARVTYDQLLQAFWHNIDPVAMDHQFCDYGRQYRSAIFYRDDAQRRAAEASKRALEASKRFDQPIATEIVPAGPFYPAEEYHQDYYRKNPFRYHFYKWSCGRARRLKQIWGARGRMRVGGPDAPLAALPPIGHFPPAGPEGCHGGLRVFRNPGWTPPGARLR